MLFFLKLILEGNQTSTLSNSAHTFWLFLFPFPGLKGSLQRLQLEYVDVVFANRPDSNTPMEGEWRSLIETVELTILAWWLIPLTVGNEINIFRLIGLNMKNKNLSSRCLSNSIFTLKANAQHPASSLFFHYSFLKLLQALGLWLLLGTVLTFFQVHFTSVIPSTKTIKLIGRRVYNTAIIIWE